jgi:hypothetical protein
MQPRYKRRSPRIGRFPVMALFIAFAVAAFLIPIACIAALLILQSGEAMRTLAGLEDRPAYVQSDK